VALTASGNSQPATFGGDDEFMVMVSTDCGGTFNPINIYNVGNPISNIGQNETLSLAPFAGQDIIVAFYGTEGATTGPNIDLFLDNILIYNQPAYDLGVSDILLPAGDFCATPQGATVVEVTNFGSNAIDPSVDPFDVTVEINGVNYQASYNTGPPLPSGATLTIPVSAAVDLTAPGVTNVKAWTTMTGINVDGLAPNDTALEPIEIVPIFSIPYVDDFETGWVQTITYAPGWNVVSNTTYRWEVEAGPLFPTTTGPAVDHTTGTAAGQYLYTETGNGSGDSTNLRSPCIELTPVTASNNVQIEFWYHFFGADIGTLKVKVLTQFGDTVEVLSIVGQQQTDEADPWLKATADLTPFKGQTVNILFTGIEGGTGTNQDLAIDDLFIFEVQPFDISANSLELPPSNVCLTDSEPVVATMIHNGITPIDLQVDTLTLTLDVAGTPLQTVDITTAPGGGSTLNPGDTITYTFTADFTAGGFIPTVFYLDLGPDLQLINDTLSVDFASGAYSAPYFENFEDNFAELTTFGPGWSDSTTSTGFAFYEWEVEGGPSTANTGPGQDNTTGVPNQGLYIYADASQFSAVQGDSTILFGPCIDLGSLTSPRLEFFYHMFGATMGSLEVQLIDGASNLVPLLTLVGQQDTAQADIDPWNRAVVDLTPYAGQVISLQFLAIRGSGVTGDIAIDDILIYQPTGIDVGVAAVNGPGTGCFFTPQEVEVSVVNFEQITLDLQANPVTVTLETTPAIPG
ncbi:MAG: hypothetical protein AAF804_12260, partial [Bacteroidota bacterium]